MQKILLHIFLIYSIFLGITNSSFSNYEGNYKKYFIDGKEVTGYDSFSTKSKLNSYIGIKNKGDNKQYTLNIYGEDVFTKTFPATYNTPIEILKIGENGEYAFTFQETENKYTININGENKITVEGKISLFKISDDFQNYSFFVQHYRNKVSSIYKNTEKIKSFQDVGLMSKNKLNYYFFDDFKNYYIEYQDDENFILEINGKIVESIKGDHTTVTYVVSPNWYFVRTTGENNIIKINGKEVPNTEGGNYFMPYISDDGKNYYVKYEKKGKSIINKNGKNIKVIPHYYLEDDFKLYDDSPRKERNDSLHQYKENYYQSYNDNGKMFLIKNGETIYNEEGEITYYEISDDGKDYIISGKKDGEIFLVKNGDTIDTRKTNKGRYNISKDLKNFYVEYEKDGKYILNKNGTDLESIDIDKFEGKKPRYNFTADQSSYYIQYKDNEEQILKINDKLADSVNCGEGFCSYEISEDGNNYYILYIKNGKKVLRINGKDVYSFNKSYASNLELSDDFQNYLLTYETESSQRTAVVNGKEIKGVFSYYDIYNNFESISYIQDTGEGRIFHSLNLKNNNNINKKVKHKGTTTPTQEKKNNTAKDNNINSFILVLGTILSIVVLTGVTIFKRKNTKK